MRPKIFHYWFSGYAQNSHPYSSNTIFRWKSTKYRNVSVATGTTIRLSYHTSSAWRPFAGRLENVESTGDDREQRTIEPVLKRFSSLKIKANDHFNRRHTGRMSRIEM
jgi:hypothetical protein